VVPEVNAHAIAQYSKKNIIANPNCSTIQMVVVLKPIHDVAGSKGGGLYLPGVSGTGKRAIKELETQVLAIYNQQEIKKEVYPIRSPLTVFLTSTSSSTMVTPRRDKDGQ